MKKKIFELNIDEIKNSIKSAEISICIIGIGRIGLPTALSFAKSGFHTVGLDINVDLVQKINSGDFPLKDEPKYDEIFIDKGACVEFKFASGNWYILSSDGLKL